MLLGALLSTATVVTVSACGQGGLQLDPELRGIRPAEGHMPSPEEIPEKYLKQANFFPLEDCGSRAPTWKFDAESTDCEIDYSEGEAIGSPRNGEWWVLQFMLTEESSRISQLANLVPEKSTDIWKVYTNGGEDDQDEDCMEFWLAEGPEVTFSMIAGPCRELPKNNPKQAAEALEKPVSVLIEAKGGL